MRRHLILLLLALLGVTAASVQARQSAIEPAAPDGVPLVVYPEHEIAGEWQPLELERIDGSPMVLATAQLEAGDLCSEATALTLPGGGSTVVNSATVSDDDPILPCMWGAPSSLQGYRTVWYQFTPEQSGLVMITTLGSNYDTVLSVHRGTCGSLQQLRCNDDWNFLTSSVELTVFAGDTYYVQVADWNMTASDPKDLRLAALIQPILEWELVDGLQQGRSRHAVAKFGDDIYIVGGQVSDQDGVPVLTNALSVYRTDLPPGQALEQLAPICEEQVGGGCTPLPLSNTTAVYAAGGVYIPSGYVGIDGAYYGQHLVYRVGSGEWSLAQAKSWADGEPAIYGAAVARGLGYYLTGGLTGPLPLEDESVAWEPRRELSFYSVLQDQWIALTPLGTGRFGHMAAIIEIEAEDYLCVVGGIGANNAGQPLIISNGECRNLEQNPQNPVSRTIGALNTARYWAGSAVDTNGNWYIFGGTDFEGKPVALTERFNTVTQEWERLDARFDLGTELNTGSVLARPPRSWPQGAFVGQDLWAFGGHITSGQGDLALNLIERVTMPVRRDVVTQQRAWLPLVAAQQPDGIGDNTLALARPIALNQVQSSTFVDGRDIADAYFFDLPSSRSITVRLTDVPIGSNYRLHLFNSSKIHLAAPVASEPGTTATISPVTLTAGRYYVVVERVFPPPGAEPSGQLYRLVVSG
ncbi:MAG: hypothetical protein R3300_04755 [Candidatus Promineifilaceae bacterium]|nr:hypothetical protein [Candidatus Promineifilaceae bacterium]